MTIPANLHLPLSLRVSPQRRESSLCFSPRFSGKTGTQRSLVGGRELPVHFGGNSSKAPHSPDPFFLPVGSCLDTHTARLRLLPWCTLTELCLCGAQPSPSAGQPLVLLTAVTRALVSGRLGGSSWLLIGTLAGVEQVPSPSKAQC